MSNRSYGKAVDDDNKDKERSDQESTFLRILCNIPLRSNNINNTEGFWTPAECENVIRTLKEVYTCLPVEDHPGQIGNWTETTERFIEELQYCVDAKVKAFFC
jgi:hypothetical protein